MAEEQKNGIWRGDNPASESAVLQLVADSGYNLPVSYLNQLRLSNGGEGDLAIEPGWVQFWPAEEVNELNEKYEVKVRLPEFFGFGSNGGGELLVFKVSDSDPWPIYMVPFIPMDVREAILIADSFDLFIKAVGREMLTA